jgi:predicted flap endonuclease-1-like 5' DNA nuclease
MAKYHRHLEYIEGVGPAYAEKLNAIGIYSCLDLIKAGNTARGRSEIAEKSGINAGLILEWINHVDLYRIKGVGSEYADLLEASGVDTVVELAQRNPASLFERLNSVNLEKHLARRLPTLSQVDDWVAQAKGLPRVVTY